jgi:biotin carboxyl carrier protein
VDYHYQVDGQLTRVAVMAAGLGFAVTVNGERVLVQATLRAPGELSLTWADGRRARAYVAADGDRRWVALDPAPEGGPVALQLPPRAGGRGRRGGAAGHDTLEAQMPGVVRRVLAAPGDRVERGQALVLLEAMKMEIRVTAPHAGVVERVGVEEGAAVERGQVLVELAATEVAADVVTDVADVEVDAGTEVAADGAADVVTDVADVEVDAATDVAADGTDGGMK